MPDYREVYAHHADRYDTLVSHEDFEGNLGRTLSELAPGQSLDVVETGAGTGRLTRILAPRSRLIRAFDASAAMIAVAANAFQTLPHIHCAVALHDSLPVENQSADLALEGWAFGHSLSWNPSGWQQDVTRWVTELERTVRPGGTVVLIETMGTGVESPFAGGHSLEPFHGFVTRDLAFSHRAIRTDYKFDSVEAAADTLGFFFGEKTATTIRDNRWSIVPECTGVYVRAVKAR